MFLNNIINFFIFFSFFLSFLTEIFMNLFHIVFDLLHYPHLHFNFHVSLFFFQRFSPFSLKLSIFIYIDDMMLLNFSLSLLCNFSHLHLFLCAQANHLSNCLSHVSVILSTIFFKYLYYFRSRKHKLDFFHKKKANRMLIVLNIFDKFYV